MQRQKVRPSNLPDQLKHPVDVMWDGLDRFCKTQEHAGKVSNDLKEFQLQTQKEIQEIYRQLSTKLNEDQYKKETKAMKEQQRTYAESCT